MTSFSDIDSIFQNNYISGVQEQLSKIRKDVEKKKEDLRVMVGERYRDLIEAADTIDDMQQSTESICSSISAIEKLCASLQQRGLIGFKTRKLTLSETSRNQEPNFLHSIAEQIKVLVDAPEILWDLTERKDYLAASEMYLLAQHTHTALQLSPKSKKISHKFPVINNQWSSISQFRHTILKGCQKVIKTEIDDWESVMKSLAATMLLEDISMEQSLRKILELRKSELQSILATSSSSLAKDQLTTFSHALMSSLWIIYKIFVGNGLGCQLQLTLTTNRQDTKFTNSLLSSPNNSGIPSKILQFRANPKGNINTLNLSAIQNEIDCWLQDVIHQSSGAIQHLLSYTTTVKALLLIRSGIEEAQQTRSTSLEWHKVLETYNISKQFNPWRSIIKERIVEKIKTLLQKELHKIKKDFQQSVLEATKEIYASKKVCAEEGDITAFVWSESPHDAPEDIGGFSNKAKNKNTGLFHKSRGFTRRVQGIAKLFNNKLSSLVQDVTSYAPTSSNVDDVTDYEEILKFVETSSVTFLSSCIEDLEKIAESSVSSEDFDAEDVWDQIKPIKPNADLTVAIIASRILMAVPVLCPQFRVCVCASYLANSESARRLTMGLLSDTDQWIDLKNSMESANSRIMERLFDMLLQRLICQLKQEFIALLQNRSPLQLIHVFPAWETVSIEEENDNGASVKSNINIPHQPSPPLVQALIKLCSSLNHIGMHTVSRQSQQQLLNHLADHLVQLYKELKDDINNFNQITAIQVIFDLKFIQLMFLPKENKEMNALVTELINELENRVDPFDWNVFLPHITTRVRSSTQRLQVILGALLTKEKQIGGKSQIAGSSVGTLIVVPSVEIPRFANVPLPDVSAITINSELEKLHDTFAIHNSLKESKTTNDLTSLSKTNASLPSSKSSASLFSVMSSSWFGS